MEDIQIIDQQSGIKVVDAKRGHVIVSLSTSDLDELAGENGLCYTFEIITASGVLVRATGKLAVVAADSEHSDEG